MNSACRLLLTSAACALGVLGSASAGLVPTNAAADRVLGQATFLTNASTNPPGPATLSKPAGVAIDNATGKVFVADEGNHRVLRYANATDLANGADAELVIGQLSYSDRQPNQGNLAPSRTSLSGPKDVFVDPAGRLWIADTGNNRVLMFQAASSSFSVPLNADRVYGQTGFTTANASATDKTLAGPEGIAVDGNGTLWVADTGSHRVLGFKDAAAAANGPAADYLIGQTSFTANTAGTMQTKLYDPAGVSTDATGHLWVADRGNNRVLMFANPPLIVGPPANIVLGQPDYVTSSAGNVTASSLAHPTSVRVSGTSLWVADDFRNRVLRFDNAATRQDGTAANAVVGQSSFTGKFPGLSSRQLALLDGHVNVDTRGALWVCDRLNNRALRFSPTDELPTVTVNGPHSRRTREAAITLAGTAADDLGIARVSYQLDANDYVRCQGTTSWTARIRIPEGSHRINVRSVDSANQASLPVVVFVTRGQPTPLRPIVTVTGAREISTTAAKITLRGTALDASGIDRVSYQLGSNEYVRCQGRETWSAEISVPVGRTRINVRSVNFDGLASAPAVVYVTRK